MNGSLELMNSSSDIFKTDYFYIGISTHKFKMILIVDLDMLFFPNISYFPLN